MISTKKIEKMIDAGEVTPALVDELARVNQEQKRLNDIISAAKKMIAADLEARGEKTIRGRYARATLVTPAPTETYDVKRLREAAKADQHLREMLEPFEKVVERRPYIRVG